MNIKEELRKKLLNEGNLKRYLIYAIGEILLVVIGILIAFQLSDWNDNRIERDKEKQHVTSMADDLRNDVININNVDFNNISGSPVNNKDTDGTNSININ